MNKKHIFIFLLVIIIITVFIISIPFIKMNLLLLHVEKEYKQKFEIKSTVKYFKKNHTIKLENKSYDYDICAGFSDGEYSDNLFHKKYDKKTKEFFDNIFLPLGSKYKLHYPKTCSLIYPRQRSDTFYNYLSTTDFYIEIPKNNYSKKLINNIAKAFDNNSKLKKIGCIIIFVPEKNFGSFSKSSNCFWLEVTANKTCEDKKTNENLGYDKIFISMIEKNLNIVEVDYKWQTDHEKGDKNYVVYED